MAGSKAMTTKAPRTGRRGRRRLALTASLASVIGLGAGAYTLYQLRIRPWQERWGATDDELTRPMVGDEVVPYPAIHATRAVTIDATPEEIWPWLVQIGYDRAGFYSADRVERFLGLTGMKSAREILPEFQQVKVGDTIPFGPQGPQVPVLKVEPNHVLALGGFDPQHGGASFVFELCPVDERHTRLVTRTRARWPNWNLRAILSQRPSAPGMPAPNLGRDLPMYLFFEPGSFLMLRQMLLGIKARAEARPLPASERLGAVAADGGALAEEIGV